MSEKPKQVLGSMKNKIVATELLEERAKGEGNDKEELRNAFWIEKWIYDEVMIDSKQMEDHPEFANSHHYYEYSSEEAQAAWRKKLNFAWKLDKNRHFGSYGIKHAWSFFHQG